MTDLEMDTINNIKKTKNYDKFKYLLANRAVFEPHVKQLVKVSGQVGNITAISPILVNENDDVIDGQHRLEAARELKQAVYYKVVPGLTIADTRQMNTSQRPWNIWDFAESYAKSNKSYREFLRLAKNYSMTYHELMAFIRGRRKELKNFRNGELSLTEDEIQMAEMKLKQFHDVKEFLPNQGREWGIAFSRLVNAAESTYDHKRMMEKIKTAHRYVQPQYRIEDCLRAYEDIYNWRVQPENRVRLF